MNETVIRTAYCAGPRSHAVARVYLDRIEFNATAIGRDFATSTWSSVPRTELDGYSAYGVPVSCACGRLATLDLVSLVGEGRTVLRPWGPGSHGASHRRRAGEA